MSDLPEAIRWYEKAEPWHNEHSDRMADAARRVLEGEQVQWCTVHLAGYLDGAPGCEFWMFAKVVKDRYGTAEPRPCSIVPKLLVDV